MSAEPLAVIGLAAVAARHPRWNIAASKDGCAAMRRGGLWVDDFTPALPVRVVAPTGKALDAALAFWDALEEAVS